MWVLIGDLFVHFLCYSANLKSNAEIAEILPS